MEAPEHDFDSEREDKVSTFFEKINNGLIYTHCQDGYFQQFARFMPCAIEILETTGYEHVLHKRDRKDLTQRFVASSSTSTGNHIACLHNARN